MSLFESTDTLFAELLLPVPIHKLFTYRVPQSIQESVQVGQRVIVQFGERKILTGVIGKLHTQPPKEYEAKYILELLDEEPVLTPIQFKFFEWLASYYCCTPGEVLNAALPAGLKLSSESMVQLHPAFDWNSTLFEFSEKEEVLLKRLAQDSLSYTDITKLLGVKHLHSILKSLVKKEAIILFEQVKDKYKPKVERRIRLTDNYLSSTQLEQLFEQLASKPKQEEVLLKYLQEIPVIKQVESNQQGISRSHFLKSDLSESSLNTLIKNGVFEEFEKIISRFSEEGSSTSQTITLSEDQRQAANQILAQF